jgi:hypothetical protein
MKEIVTYQNIGRLKREVLMSGKDNPMQPSKHS